MKRILIAEDEEILRMLLCDTLEDDYEVTEAENGLEAIQLIREHTFDLLLIDFMMPFYNGVEVIESAREAGVTTPIVMLTAKTQDYDRQLALDAGANYFVAKPFSPMELLEFVHSVI